MMDKELISWAPEKEKLIKQTIYEFLSILSIDENGRVSTTQSFELDSYLRILSMHIKINGIDSASTVSHLVYRAIFNRLKKYRQQGIFGFRKALAAEARQYLKRPTNDYWMLMPLHIHQHELASMRSITILGTKLFVRDWKHCSSRFDLQDFFEETQFHLGDFDFNYQQHFTPVKVSSSGKDYREAFSPAEQGFDFLRWLINLQFQYGRITYRWGGMPKPLGKVLPPPTYGIFNQDGSYETMFYTLRRYDEYPRNNLPPSVIPNVRKLSRSLGNPSDAYETRDILINAIGLYGEALDAHDWRHSFLSLWQLLELTTLQSKSNLSMNQVKKRVLNIIPDHKTFSPLLNSLYATRNSLVHTGAFPDQTGLNEVNLLKVIAEQMINKLFSLIRVYKSRERLERYYRHVQLDSRVLKDRGRIIRNILSSR